MKKKHVVDLVEIRNAVADYLNTEGCSCCQDRSGHDAAMERIGTLLRIPKYSDGSGYDFSPFTTHERAKKRRKG